MPGDPFDLDRFVAAQRENFALAIGELTAGRKRTHWIWYVFPQLKGLGTSAMSGIYGIVSLDEARAYLAHPVLGSRLMQAAAAALASGEPDPHQLFGAPDDMKVRSSLTLFLVADPSASTLADALAQFYGAPDPATLRLLGQSADSPVPGTDADSPQHPLPQA